MSLPPKCPFCKGELDHDTGEGDNTAHCANCGIMYAGDAESLPDCVKEKDLIVGIHEAHEAKDLEGAALEILKAAAGKTLEMEPRSEIQRNMLDLVYQYNMAATAYLSILVKISHHATGSPIGYSTAQKILLEEVGKIVDIQKKLTMGRAIDKIRTDNKEPFRFVLNLISDSHDRIGEYINELIDISHKVDSAGMN